MRPLDAFRTLSLVLALTVWSSSSTRADEPKQAEPTGASVVEPGENADDMLRRGIELERKRSWTAAIEVYDASLHRWPERADVRQRLRLCESHYKLSRRYTDASFRTVLLRLPADKALDLYDELLERIESHYVEAVALEPLLRHGLDNLEVALRDPAFLQANAPTADADRLKRLRDTFRSHRERIPARGRDDARRFVIWACTEARSALGIGSAAIVLEFAFGACDALDDYSNYLTPDKLDDLFGLIDGNFVGLGVELKVDDQGLRLVNVLPGGPAAEAGLRIGDRITHVAGRVLKGLALDEAAGTLQGEEGTTVEIGVLPRSGESRRLNLTRRAVEVRSVSQSRIVDPIEKVGYVQLTGFQKTSTEELRKAISGLERQGMRYLVLDLRGNPGGLLNVAVDIADLFLDQGVIVTTRGRASNQSAVYPAHAGALWRMPVAVLVDHDSASASEILAGALKDNRRAVIVGERSYGKGSVQSIFPLRTAPAGLKLTTARFYSPKDRPYSEQGVEPDLPVTARIAAKPARGSTSAPEIEFGDPLHDPVLDRAIQQAKRQLSTVR
ncbi:MAG: C-terminal processing peptidase [Planctomycetota bacterium]|nr:C-terminal processing peptidase [Planctomycetota bacterium]